MKVGQSNYVRYISRPLSSCLATQMNNSFDLVQSTMNMEKVKMLMLATQTQHITSVAIRTHKVSMTCGCFDVCGRRMTAASSLGVYG
jgi:hypothetical protein